MLSLQNCTIFGNEADAGDEEGEPGGGGVYVTGQSTVTLENSVIASSTRGEGIWCDAGIAPEVRCCDVWGNANGDWVGCVADLLGIDGNLSSDPRFCDTPTGNFGVELCSPCLPGNHPDGYDCAVRIGAYSSDCECGAGTEPRTWGAIKAMYR
jgi:hypothetical protein